MPVNTLKVDIESEQYEKNNGYTPYQRNCRPQENVNFYSIVLGVRLVKQTVNDQKTYHQYFGNADAKPGTIITLFPWGEANNGIIGEGQVDI